MKNYRGRESEKVFCKHCGKDFLKDKYELRNTKNNFCSLKCKGNYDKNNPDNHAKGKCLTCGVEIWRILSHVQPSKKLFCSKSCAAIHNNQLRRRTRRSKIEKEFFETLQSLFPLLPMTPNDKEILDGLEVDVAIPSLALAIEWNGVVHFQPIYGNKQMSRIQNKDAEKQRIALKKGINLIIIADLDSKRSTLEKALKDTSDIITAMMSDEYEAESRELESQ